MKEISFKLQQNTTPTPIEPVIGMDQLRVLVTNYEKILHYYTIVNTRLEQEIVQLRTLNASLAEDSLAPQPGLTQ